MKVYKKLMEVQNALKAPKSQYNKFGKYNYRNCEDILEAVKPLLKEHQATIVISDEIVLIGERYYVKATCKFIDIEDGSVIENSALAREELTKKGMDSSQLTGSTSSYARKYALNGLLCIDDTKDSDTTNTHGKDDNSNNNSSVKESLVEEKHTKAIYAVCKAKGISEAQLNKSLKKDYGKDSKKDLTMKDFRHLMDRLNKAPDKEVK